MAMPVDDAVMRSARNAFLALLVVLIGVSGYQFVTIGKITPEIAVVWVTGAGTFYLSKWHYGRREGDFGASAADGEAEN